MFKKGILLLAATFSVFAMDDMEWEGYIEIGSCIISSGKRYTSKTISPGKKELIGIEIYRHMRHPFFEKGIALFFTDDEVSDELKDLVGKIYGYGEISYSGPQNLKHSRTKSDIVDLDSLIPAKTTREKE